MFLPVAAVRELREQQSSGRYWRSDPWKLSALAFKVLHWVMVYVCVICSGESGSETIFQVKKLTFSLCS